MSARKLKKSTPLDRKIFMWGVINTDVTAAALMTKKGGGGWETRYVVLSRNYIVYYKPNNDDGSPKQFDYCKGVINLSQVKPSDVRFYHEKPDEKIFQVPLTTGSTYLFKCKDEATLERWVRLVREKADAVVAANPEALGNVTQTIPTIQASFPKNVTFPSKVNTDGVQRYFEQTRKTLQGLDQWEPYLRKASLFFEFYFGTNRAYMDWFTGGDGPRVLFERSQDQVLNNWRTTIETTLKDARNAGRLRFFQEDFEETAQLCEHAVQLIDALNQYHREFMKNVHYQDQYAVEKDALTKLIAMFRAFPPLRAVDFRAYKGGTITGKGAGAPEWDFVIQGASVQLKGTARGADMVFNCVAPEIMSPSSVHGSVIWNTKTWVWYHPSSPFLIRFDWNSQSNTFKFKSTHLEGLPNTVYADWALKGSSLQCMAEPGKQSPSVLVWEVSGSVPVPAALVAGMAELILDALKMLNVS